MGQINLPLARQIHLMHKYIYLKIFQINLCHQNYNYLKQKLKKNNTN